jgi:hypothetical protein
MVATSASALLLIGVSDTFGARKGADILGGALIDKTCAPVARQQRDQQLTSTNRNDNSFCSSTTVAVHTYDRSRHSLTASTMAEVQSLEQRFESISVQDENLDINTAIAAQSKQKVHHTFHLL